MQQLRSKCEQSAKSYSSECELCIAEKSIRTDAPTGLFMHNFEDLDPHELYQELTDYSIFRNCNDTSLCLLEIVSEKHSLEFGQIWEVGLHDRRCFISV